MSEAQKTVRLEFENNTLMTIICGQHNQHLARIEQALNVQMDSFGNQIKISGLPDKVELASKTFTSLYQQLSAQDNQDEISATLVDDVLRQTENGVNPATTPIDKSLFATTWKKKIFPRTAGQATYFKLLRDHEVVFGLGPAGTGKTYMAVAWAVDFLKRRQVERIILSRPAVEAGERLGFLPGDMKEKVDPYLRPLYDALYDMMPSDKVDRMIANGEIEIAPLAFMRGRTLSNAFVIIDEAQNTTPVQMKMVLTRLGEDSRMAITGDLSQIDLPSGQLSGLSDAVNRLDGVKGIGITRLSGEDVVRHPVVARILKAYETGQK
ncbi:MAG: PhoH family protein [Pseudomonadota bacterium]|nr:PhoH family protein [Pseudomonadota bacterium]MEC7245429.1 PhoH family protein [Pseudomonadota bacterium]